MTAHATTAMRGNLATVIDRETRALLRQVRRARRGEARAVHQARVASRRLGEAVPVAVRVVTDVKAPHLRRDVRRVARAMGDVRELDVTLAVLDREARGREWHGAVLGQVRRHLEKERERSSRTMNAKLGRVDLAKLEERAHELADACDARLLPGWQSHLATRLRKRARRFDQALRAAGTLYAAEPLHRVRVAGKRLRYTLELARAAAGAPVGRHIATLKRLQDLLGSLHDLQTLEAFVRTVAAEAVSGLDSHAQFEDAQREIDAECRVLHGRFLARAPQWERLVDQAAQQASVLVAPRRSPTMLKAAPPAALRPGRARTATA